LEPTKTCPSCGALAPVSARRCKECFHDFSARTENRRAWALPILAGLLVMASIAAGVVTWVTSYPADQRAIVDTDTKTVQWVRTFQDGRIETDRVDFADVSRIQYINGGAVGFQIIAITASGEQKIIESSTRKPLMGNAERYAKMMEKPLEIVGEPAGVE
jgi:hypothetical protein